MAQTKIRSSKQLAVDANLDVTTHKIINLAAGSTAGDAVEFAQLNTAIANAVSGSGNSLHVPVADLAAAKAVSGVIAPNGHVDKMIMLIETLGLYRYDADSTAVSNDDTVIRPTDIASDVTAGRWIKMTSTITDHNNLTNKQGGITGEYFHLTQAELTKLIGIEAGADVTDAVNIASSITGSAAITTPADADVMPILVGGVLKKVAWSVIKSTLVTYLDTLYNKYVHPNHTGDVTSVGDGAQTIAANAVTNAKAAQMANSTIKGRVTAGTGNPEDLTVAQVKTLLGLTSLNLAQRKYRQAPVGTINGTNTNFSIADLILSGTEEVYLNGILMNGGAGNDYTIVYAASSVITFIGSAIPQTGDVILVSYSV